MKNEVKLIISDMDGTLLHDFDKQVPNDLPYVVKTLYDRGIIFVFASGRQRASVEEKLKDVKTPHISFGDNAGVLYLNDQMISVFEVDKDLLKIVTDIIRKEPDIYVTATMADGMSYYEDSDPRVKKDMEEFYVNYEFIDDITKAPGQLIKISFLDYVDPKGRGINLLKEAATGYNLMPTGGPWIDIVRKEVSKGYGLQIIVDQLGLTMDNVMAFGDSGNDISMLKLAKYSFAMENALDSVKEISRYRCLSVNDDGVTKKLKEIFEIE